MLAALALAAAFLFQPFHVVAVIRQPDGEIATASTGAKFTSRAACEVAMKTEVARLVGHNYSIITDEGPAEVVGVFCLAEGMTT
jgi:hypothetical protein